MPTLIFFSVFVVSTCGLIYEFISATVASYTLGDTVTQFSLVIGFYLFSMGCGSYFSKYIKDKPIERFITIELIIAVLGGLLPVYLFGLYPFTAHFKVLLLSYISLIGFLVGIEIPLMMRILKDNLEFEDLVARIFTFDYIGALLASIAFPLVFMPYFGLIETGLIFGMVNAFVALMTLIYFKKRIKGYRFIFAKCLIVCILLVGFLINANHVEAFLDSLRFDEKIIFKKNSSYQKIVLTGGAETIKLYLNGNLQFSSKDEYRYHEALVHVGLSQIQNPSRVLILGGGDGLAAREILKYPSVKEIILVDLDPEMTKLCKTLKPIVTLNHNALNDTRLKIIHKDAFIWLKENNDCFDFVVIDFPDPSNYSVGKLYTRTFYYMLKKMLHKNSIVAIQSTSPYVAPKSYWCVAKTLQSVGLKTASYQIHLPSFGNWGFHLATLDDQYSSKFSLPRDLKYLTPEIVPTLFIYPKDQSHIDTKIHDLNNQALVQYFDEEWHRTL